MVGMDLIALQRRLIVKEGNQAKIIGAFRMQDIVTKDKFTNFGDDVGECPETKGKMLDLTGIYFRLEFEQHNVFQHEPSPCLFPCARAKPSLFSSFLVATTSPGRWFSPHHFFDSVIEGRFDGVKLRGKLAGGQTAATVGTG